MDFIETRQDAAPEKAVLLSVDTGDFDADASVNELEELAKTAGAEVLAVVVQRREAPSPSTYIGSGRLAQLVAFCGSHEADLLIADGELSPVQVRNIEDACGVRTIDRTALILDIFAARARSAEGKIQVELAQLKYLLPRLSGQGKSLSRLGGGIGTRGPGETKLETDRRHIRRRIEHLNDSLEKIRKRRLATHTRRQKNAVLSAVIVGYTNAGKSTLMNRLTHAGVLAEDKLFATLDTTTRKVELPGGSEILLTDTVGFIQKLPHHLIQAFRATLEELKYADILLHVVDASNPNREEQMRVVYDTLRGLGCEDTPVITVYNKMDREVELPLPMDRMAREIVQISAGKQMGLEQMLATIEKLLKSFRKSMTVLLPYTEGALAGWVHGRCEIIREEHTAEGVLLEVYVDEEAANRLKSFAVEG